MLNSFAEINFIAVLVAAVAYFLVGWAWYSPMLFGNAYLKEMKLDPKKMKMENMGVIFGASFICGLLTAFVIKAVMIATFADTVFLGANIGVLLSVGLIGTNAMNDALYDNHSTKLFFIKVGYNVLGFIVMGAILGAWK